MKEGRISAIGFGGGAGLNGRRASFAVPLRFLVASLSPVLLSLLGARHPLDQAEPQRVFRLILFAFFLGEGTRICVAVVTSHKW